MKVMMLMMTCNGDDAKSDFGNDHDANNLVMTTMSVVIRMMLKMTLVMAMMLMMTLVITIMLILTLIR